jgi:lysozyme
MKTSEKGVAFVAAHEGVVTKAYRDVGGVWTIGVGHTAPAGAPIPKAGMTITGEQALQILAADLPKYEAGVGHSLGPVAQTVFDGAVSFHFNTGAIGKASWVKLFQAGKRPEARASLMGWVKAGGRTIAGLVRRRGDEARLIFDGDYRSAAATIANPDTPASGDPAPGPSDEVGAYQKQLTTLGFYDGAVDGVAGPKTKAAVLAYQKAHPDLVADAVAGPATQASLTRDVAARQRSRQAAGAAVASAVTAGLAAGHGGGHAILWAFAIGLAVLLLCGGLIALRYGGELRRIFSLKKGT